MQTKLSISLGAPGSQRRTDDANTELLPNLANNWLSYRYRALTVFADVVLCCCRLYRADNKVLLYSGIAQALLTAWALLLSVTAGTQPVIACECHTMYHSVEKQRPM